MNIVSMTVEHFSRDNISESVVDNNYDQKNVSLDSKEDFSEV